MVTSFFFNQFLGCYCHNLSIIVLLGYFANSLSALSCMQLVSFSLVREFLWYFSRLQKMHFRGRVVLGTLSVSTEHWREDRLSVLDCSIESCWSASKLKSSSKLVSWTKEKGNSLSRHEQGSAFLLTLHVACWYISSECWANLPKLAKITNNDMKKLWVVLCYLNLFTAQSVYKKFIIDQNSFTGG